MPDPNRWELPTPDLVNDEVAMDLDQRRHLIDGPVSGLLIGRWGTNRDVDGSALVRVLLLQCS